MNTAAEAKHTKGPWVRVPQSNGGDLIAHRYETGNQMNPTGLRLIAFMMARGNSIKEDEANASLMMAAPDMLAALKRCEAMVSTDQGPPNWDWVREVIAKAVAS